MTVAGTKTRATVYATTAFSRTERIDDGYVHVPVAWSKTWGSTKALCGADSATWPKFYEPLFHRVERNRCLECTLAAVTMSRRHSASTSDC